MSYYLTPKMQQLKIFIIAYTAQNGIAPNFDEMKAHLGLASKSGIYRMLTAMEERGHIRRLPNKARAIRVIDRSDCSAGALLKELWENQSIRNLMTDRQKEQCLRHAYGHYETGDQPPCF